MDDAVARNASGGVWITGFRGLPVDAGIESLHFVGMTLHAFSRNQFFGSGEFVHAAMTRSARGFAEGGVNAGEESLGFVRMAGGALHSCNFGGMRKILDVGVAVL